MLYRELFGGYRGTVYQFCKIGIHDPADQDDDMGSQSKQIEANAIKSCCFTLNYMIQLSEYEEVYQEDTV